MSILIRLLEEYQVQLDVSVLFLDIVKLMLLELDWLVYNVISYDVKQTFDNISKVWFTLKNVTDKWMTLVLLFSTKCDQCLFTLRIAQNIMNVCVA